MRVYVWLRLYIMMCMCVVGSQWDGICMSIGDVKFPIVPKHTVSAIKSVSSNWGRTTNTIAKLLSPLSLSFYLSLSLSPSLLATSGAPIALTHSPPTRPIVIQNQSSGHWHSQLIPINFVCIVLNSVIVWRKREQNRTAKSTYHEV